VRAAAENVVSTAAVSVEVIKSSLLIQGPKHPCLVLAHGAGAGMDSEWMQRVSDLLVARGVGVVRFEFPYMQQRRAAGTRRPPDRQPRLLEHWQQVVASLDTPVEQLVIAGKSMGGRMASMLADELGVAGLVCLGYPFHPQGKPEKLRTEHLLALKTPSLFVQGSRDALGNREEVGGYGVSSAIELLWLEDGDHDMKPRVKSGFTQAQHLSVLADRVATFVHSQVSGSPR